MARYLTLALKRQKMTQLWSLLAAEPFNLDDRIIAYPTISFILRTMASVSFPNFEQNSSNKSARFGPIEKFGTSVRPEVEIGDQRPSTGWYPERFPIDPENFGFLSDQVLEILGKMTFLLTRAPPGDGVENQKSVLQFWRYPRGAQIRERTSRNSVGKCSVPALHPPKTWKE